MSWKGSWIKSFNRSFKNIKLIYCQHKINRMNIADCLAQSTHILATSPTARLDAEILLADVLHISREKLYLSFERLLTSSQLGAMNEYVARRAKGEPIAYLVGRCEFWSLDLCMMPGVLVPRPETEMLVEQALKYLSENRCCCVAALGTGSGAIALALAHERPSWKLVATDRSAVALALAQHNGQRLKRTNIQYYLGDWCHALPDQKFDAIISNPPYISSDDLHLINLDVTFEPKSALFSDNNGLSDIQQICEQARAFLRSGGYLIIEHGFNHGAAARNIFKHAGYSSIVTYRDLANHERMTCARIL